MAKVLKYLLTSVMLSLSHNDRLVNSTSKSNLLNYVNSQFVTGHSSSIDGTIIGAAFFLHLQINPLDTVGGIARSILNQIIGGSEHTTHFGADK